MHDAVSYTTPWIKVSFVCTYWRQTALDCLEFWSILNPANGSEYLSTMIPRSRAFPLSVSGWGHCLQSEAMACLLPELHRVRHLDLTHALRCGFQCNARSSISQFIAPAPLLQSFKLNCWPTNIEYLPDHLFSGTTSQIRSIDLAGWMIPTTISSFGGLRDLTLSGIDRQGGPYLHQLFIMLRSAPNLENLVLQSAFRDGRHVDEDILHLPFLKSLKIKCSTLLSLLTAYSHIVHPKTTRIRLIPSVPTLNDSDDNADCLRGLGRALSDRVVVRHAQIRHQNSIIEMSLSELDTDSTTTTEAGAVLLLPEGCSESLTATFFEGLQLSQVQYLSIEGKLNEFVWRIVYGRLEFLTTLCIYDGYLHPKWFYACNYPDNSEVAFDISGDRCFRSLRTLVLHGWNLDEAGVCLIGASLEARASNGFGLHTLRIVDGKWSGITVTEAVNWLQRHVEHIELEGANENSDGDHIDSKGAGDMDLDVDSDSRLGLGNWDWIMRQWGGR
ncbi:hypothetical protein DXG01_012858 [Tephrocybe rancida]|nr:hypothetical protein DXG01_012858 [Tephrocybe rancida]